MRKNPKQLLALILKCYCYVSDDFISKIAPLVEIDSEQLRKMIDKIRISRAKRDAEIYLMRERIYSQFYRCIIYENRLLYMTENSTAAILMKRKLFKARQRLHTMRKRLASIRIDATNKQVAEVIGISKGSVDAHLYQLKLRWNKMTDKSLLN
jgi:hypothetical protein